jgi:type VI secretion system secreted protein Hcp
MALDAYLKMTGQNLGALNGSVTEQGFQDHIAVVAVNHGIVSWMRTGAPKGHQPLVITKPLDKSSPLLYQALSLREYMSEWELQQLAPTGGKPQKQFTIKLTDARIAAIHYVMPNNRYPDLSKLAEYEEIAFMYKRIEWTWVQGNIQASDSVDYDDARGWVLPGQQTSLPTAGRRFDPLEGIR